MFLPNSDTHNLDQSLSGTTLANLKKQRAQSRTGGGNGTASENGSLVTTTHIGGSSNGTTSIAHTNGTNSHVGNNVHSNNKLNAVQPLDLAIVSNNVQTAKITKFSGVTSDVVSDSTSRRCCTIM